MTKANKTIIELKHEQDKNEREKKQLLNKELRIYYYAGFEKPKKIAKNIKELLTDVRVESNYMGDMTKQMKEDMIDCMEWYIEAGYVDIEEFVEELRGILYEYSIWVNPSLQDFEDYNESVMLPRNTYLEDFTW